MRVAQHSVHLTLGSLRVFQVFSRLSFFLSGQLRRPRPAQVTQPVGRFALELIYSYVRLLYNDFVPFITNRLIL